MLRDRAIDPMNPGASPAAPDLEWYRHYGFDRDPFAEGGVHGLFYPGGARQETVEQLQHLARYSDCVLLVTGVAGAGKSAARRHFVAQAGADVRCCVIESALLDGAEQWLRRVLAGFALRPTGNPEIAADLQQLAEYCAARNAAGTRCWLVIDDGHDLHPDVVAILGRLIEATGRNLRLCFFAEPRWRDALQSALPPAIALHTLELQPFDAGETWAYLHYRLNTAGLEGEPPFNAQEFERIQRESGGLPGRINTIAREVLGEAANVVEQPLKALPLWHFAVIAATLLALLLLYLWGAIDQDQPRPERPVPGVADEATTDATASVEEPVPTIQVVPAGPAAEERNEESGVAAPAQAARQQGSSTMGLAEGDRAQDAARHETDEPDLPAAGVVEPSPAAPPAQPQPVDTAAQATVATTSVPGGVAAAGTQPPARPTQAVPDVAAPAQEAKATESATGAADPNEFVYRAEGRAGGAATGDETYLLGLDPGHFVLQIMGSDDGPRVRAFASRSGVPLRMYRKLHNGREWYALVHGEYASRAEAEAAARDLPERLRETRPWVRRLDTVQNEIRAARAM